MSASRPRNYTTHTKKLTKSKIKTAPNTADEYLAMGVDFEEGGEKWRGGDAQKSLRFFNKAIDCYGEGLQKFPDSFDLAYNKARVLFEIIEYPQLLQYCPGSTPQLLGNALAASRFAQKLQPENPDILFNTAQILSTILEESSGPDKPNHVNSLILAQEALDLFQNCLEQQETLARDQKISHLGLSESSNLDSKDEGVPILTGKESVSQEECWARIVEPVTDDILLDTVLAIMETLTSFSVEIHKTDIEYLRLIEEQANAINSKFDIYLTNKNRKVEAHSIRAQLHCALAIAKFNCSLIDVFTLTEDLERSFTGVDLTDHPAGLCGRAQSHSTYCHALRIHPEADTQAYLELRWKALTKAMEYLASASKLSIPENLKNIYLARGDTELSRFQLGQSGLGLAVSRSNSSILLKNAEKYYRGCANFAKIADDKDLFIEANVKEALAVGLAGDITKLNQVGSAGFDDCLVHRLLSEAAGEGLITTTQLKEIGTTIG